MDQAWQLGVRAVGSIPPPSHALECSQPPVAPKTLLLSPSPAITHAIPQYLLLQSWFYPWHLTHLPLS